LDASGWGLRLGWGSLGLSPVLGQERILERQPAWLLNINGEGIGNIRGGCETFIMICPPVNLSAICLPPHDQPPFLSIVPWRVGIPDVLITSTQNRELLPTTPSRFVSPFSVPRSSFP
jgi:hypothetical protein